MSIHTTSPFLILLRDIPCRSYRALRKYIPFSVPSTSTRSFYQERKPTKTDLSCMAVDIPELDEAGKPGLLRSRWFPMVITEAATLHVVLLTAASHYASSRNIPQISSILFKMKGEAIRSINAGLRNTTEEITDQLIGAVAKMASYEAMFGDPNLFHLHMRAVYRMVKIRGGLETLGLNGLLGRMVLWIDINSSFLLNSTLYFAPLVTLAGHVPPKPNPAHFLGES